jgi:5-methylcytosine-specific restriction endonuclease McrA
MRPSHDHVVPLTKGGSNTPDNVRLAHRGCNSSKGNRGVRNFRISTPDPTRPSHRKNSAVLKLHE